MGVRWELVQGIGVHENIFPVVCTGSPGEERTMPKAKRVSIPWSTIKIAIVVVSGWLVLTSGPRSVQAGPAADAGDATVVRDSTEVQWRLLASLDYRSGDMSDELAAVVDGPVRVPGFMVPLEDWAEEVTEFLLVPYVGACVHTPPPPPNQLVYVVMEEGQKVPVSFWEPVWVYGDLTIEETTNVYSEVSFKIAGTSITPYEW